MAFPQAAPLNGVAREPLTACAAASCAAAKQGLPLAEAPSKPGHSAPDFYVAVPSYGRQTSIGQKTLALLARQGIPREKVFIFVADEDEKARYAAELNGEWPNIVVGVHTLWRQRNFISKFFDEGSHVVSMDDDVEEIYRIVGEPASRHWVPLLEGNLEELIRDAWQEMERHGAYLWSLNVTSNPARAEPGRITLRNGLCNGFFWGCRVRRLPELVLRHGDGHEDVERTVRYFQRDGAVLRYRELCAKTRCKMNPGGLQASMTADERKAEEDRGVESLVREFPHLLAAQPGAPLGVRFLQPKHRGIAARRFQRRGSSLVHILDLQAGPPPAADAREAQAGGSSPSSCSLPRDAEGALSSRSQAGHVVELRCGPPAADTSAAREGGSRPSRRSQTKDIVSCLSSRSHAVLEPLADRRQLWPDLWLIPTPCTSRAQAGGRSPGYCPQTRPAGSGESAPFKAEPVAELHAALPAADASEAQAGTDPSPGPQTSAAGASPRASSQEEQVLESQARLPAADVREAQAGTSPSLDLQTRKTAVASPRTRSQAEQVLELRAGLPGADASQAHAGRSPSSCSRTRDPPPSGAAPGPPASGYPRSSLVQPELFECLTQEGRLGLLRGAVWAAAPFKRLGDGPSGGASRGQVQEELEAPAGARGTRGLRLLGEAPGVPRHVVVVSAMEFYIGLCEHRVFVLWLPPGACAALGLAPCEGVPLGLERWACSHTSCSGELDGEAEGCAAVARMGVAGPGSGRLTPPAKRLRSRGPSC